MKKLIILRVICSPQVSAWPLVGRSKLKLTHLNLLWNTAAIHKNDLSWSHKQSSVAMGSTAPFSIINYYWLHFVEWESKQVSVPGTVITAFTGSPEKELTSLLWAGGAGMCAVWQVSELNSCKVRWMAWMHFLATQRFWIEVLFLPQQGDVAIWSVAVTV